MKKSLVLSKIEGFTLVEILVVATIIALLAAVAAVSYSSLSKSSRDAKRKADLEQVRAAIEIYRSNNDSSSYPTGDWTALGTALIGPPKYIESMPSDPVSSKYNYYYSGSVSDYTIGAYLESSSSTTCGACGTGIVCNYCLGPYGKK